MTNGKCGKMPFNATTNKTCTVSATAASQYSFMPHSQVLDCHVITDIAASLSVVLQLATLCRQADSCLRLMMIQCIFKEFSSGDITLLPLLSSPPPLSSLISPFSSLLIPVPPLTALFCCEATPEIQLMGRGRERCKEGSRLLLRNSLYVE